MDIADYSGIKFPATKRDCHQYSRLHFIFKILRDRVCEYSSYGKGQNNISKVVK